MRSLGLAALMTAVAAGLLAAGSARGKAVSGAGAPKPCLLLERSTALTGTKGWGGFVLHIPYYKWIRPTEVLGLRGGVDEGWRLFRCAVNSGKQTPLEGLSREFNSPRSGLMGVEVSPDGKRLLWTTAREGKPLWVVASLDGTGRQEWPRRKVGMLDAIDPFAWSWASWTDGGRSVVETSLEPDAKDGETFARLSIKGVDPPAAAAPLTRFRWPVSAFPPVPPSSHHQTAMGQDDYGTLQNRANDDVALFVQDLARPEVRPRRCVTHLPPHANFAELKVSPQGDRIVWELGSPYDRRSSAETGRHLPLGMWVSRVDGSGLHELGHLPRLPGKERWQYEHLGGVEWTPDGKSVSFIWNGTLYVCPAS